MKMRFSKFLVLFSAFILLSSSYAFATIRGVTYPDNARVASVTGWTINTTQRYVAYGATIGGALLTVLVPGVGGFAGTAARVITLGLAKKAVAVIVAEGAMAALGFLAYRAGTRPNNSQSFVAHGFAFLCPYSPAESGKTGSAMYRITAKNVVMPPKWQWERNTNVAVTANILVEEAGADARWSSLGAQPANFTIKQYTVAGTDNYVATLNENSVNLAYPSNLNSEVTLVIKATQAKGGIRWNDIELGAGSTISTANPCSEIPPALKSIAASKLAEATAAAASLPSSTSAHSGGSGGSSAPAASGIPETGSGSYASYIYIPAPRDSKGVSNLEMRNSSGSTIVSNDGFTRVDEDGSPKIVTFSGKQYRQYLVNAPDGGWTVVAWYGNGDVYKASFSCSVSGSALSCSSAGTPQLVLGS